MLQINNKYIYYFLTVSKCKSKDTKTIFRHFHSIELLDFAP